jgi:hypothetical protein
MEAEGHREDTHRGMQPDGYRADSNQGTEAADPAAKAGVRQAVGHKAAVHKATTAHKVVRHTDEAAARSKAEQRRTRQSLSPSKP